MTEKKTITAIIFVLILAMQVSYGEFIVAASDNLSAASSDIDIVNTPLIMDSNFEVTQYNLARDFFAASNYRYVDMCACSTFADLITITNTGNIRDTYKITTNKEYAKPAVSFIELDSGQSTQIINYIRPGCNDFSQDFKVRVESSSLGKVKEMTQTLNNVLCDNINQTAINTILTATPCVQTSGSFKIHNPLDFTEKYYFDTNVLENNVLFSQNPLVLASGQSADVYTYYNPSCDVYGEFQGDITVYTDNTKIQKEIPIFVNISRKYDYQVIVSSVGEACNNAQTKIPITIINKENFSNIYDLTVPFSFWYKLDETKIELDSKSQKTVYLSLNPKFRNEKTKNISLKIVSKLGKINTYYNLLIDIPQCYTFDLEYLSSKDICSDTEEISFKVNNTGTKDGDFFLYFDGPEFGELQTEKLFVRAGQTRDFDVDFEFKDENKKYLIKVFASRLDGSFKEKQEFFLNVKDLKSCYALDIEIPVIKQNYSEKEYNLSVTHIGMKQAEYDAEIDSKIWADLAFDEIELSPGQKTNLLLNIDPNDNIEQGKYQISLNISQEDKKASYSKEFDIVIYKENLLEDLKNWFSNKSDFIKNNIVVPILLIILIGFLAAVMFSYFEKNKNDKKKLLVKK